MARYIKAALPSGLKVESETYIKLNEEFVDADNSMTEREKTVYAALYAKDKLTPAEISKATGLKNVELTISKMLERDAVFIYEKIVENYRPRTEIYVELNAEHSDKQKVATFFDMISRAKKKEAMLLAYLDLSKWMNLSEPYEVKKEDLLKMADAGQPMLKQMADMGIFRLYTKEINRFACLNGKELQKAFRSFRNPAKGIS